MIILSAEGCLRWARLQLRSLLHLPVIEVIAEVIERKARELGFEPATLLTAFGSDPDLDKDN